MKPWRYWLIAALAVIVLGAGLVAVLRRAAPAPVGEAAPVAGRGGTPQVQPADPAPLPAADTGTPPPWTAGAAGRGTASDQEVLAALQASRAQRQQQSQAMLEALRARSDQSARATSAALAELDRRAAANEPIPGVNAEALRNNLLLSQQMQRLAGDVQQLSMQPADAGRTRALQAKLNELQRLQGRLRYDVLDASTAPATGKQ